MNHTDPVLQRLAQLAPRAPSDATSARIFELASMRLRPRAVHLAWSVAVAGSVVIYLSWALHFVSRLSGSG
jgi:hypothetical protein